MADAASDGGAVTEAKSTINYHIQQVYEDGELNGVDAKRKFGNSEFSTKPLKSYNWDIVISVGCRVKSQRDVEFRLWAAGASRQLCRAVFYAYPRAGEGVILSDFFMQIQDSILNLHKNNGTVWAWDEGNSLNATRVRRYWRLPGCILL